MPSSTFSLWGALPSATTVVNSSPTPNTTTFPVVSILGFWQGQEITVNGNRTFITGISGLNVSVSPALPSIAAGNVVSAYAYLLTNKHLNMGALWKIASVADLKALSRDRFEDYSSDAEIYCVIKEWGVYRWDGASYLPGDNEIILLPDDLIVTDPGRWVLEFPHADAIFSYTEPYTAVNGNLVETITQIATINPANILANTSNDESVSVIGAEVGDEVIVTPPSTINSGVIVIGFVFSTDVVYVRHANCTTGAINPGSGDYRITVRKYQA